MRCVVGVVLFVVLYFGGLQLLGEIVTARAIANDGYSQKAARTAGAKVVSKYHAVVAVGAGVLAIVGCSLPTMLIRLSERSEQRAYGREFERV